MPSPIHSCRRAPCRTAARLVLATLGVMGTACAAGSGGPGADVASEAEWIGLRRPRPAPLEGAATVAVGEVGFVGDYPWPAGAAVGRELGLGELVAAGLLRRRDVRFVERRRFAAASRAEREGRPRRPGQPPTGVSPAADYAVNAVWIATGEGALLEVRLVSVEGGAVAGSARLRLPANQPPVQLARSVVRGALEVLSGLDRLPDWDDPLAAGNGPPSGDVSNESLLSFLRGLAREEVWDWEGARRGYQVAAADPGFPEAAAALARAARLRLGGTLGES